MLVEQKNGKVLLFEIETGKLVESSERISANMDSKMNTQNSILRSLQLNGPNEQFMLRRTDNQVEVVDVSGKVYTRYELTGTEFNLHLIPGTKTILTTITEKKLFKEVDYIVLATPEKGTIRIREVEKGSKEPLLNSGELQIGYLTPDKRSISLPGAAIPCG